MPDAVVMLRAVLAPLADLARDLSRLIVPVACAGCGLEDVPLCESCSAVWWEQPFRAEEGAGRLAVVGRTALPVWSIAELDGSPHRAIGVWKDGRRRDLDRHFAADGGAGRGPDRRPTAARRRRGARAKQAALGPQARGGHQRGAWQQRRAGSWRPGMRRSRRERRALKGPLERWSLGRRGGARDEPARPGAGAARGRRRDDGRHAWRAPRTLWRRRERPLIGALVLAATPRRDVSARGG